MKKILIYLLLLSSVGIASIGNLYTDEVYAFDFTLPFGESISNQNVGYPQDHTVYCEEVHLSGSQESSWDFYLTHWERHETQSNTTYAEAKTATDCITIPYKEPYPSCTPYDPCK